MKRRELLTLGLAFAAGAGLSAAFYETGLPNPSAAPVSTAGDLERQLIQMVRPESAALPAMFPQYPDYDATISELVSRGLVTGGALDMGAIDSRRADDPIIDFAGWQHLETELLVLLAAHQLAGDKLTVTLQGDNKLSFNNFDVFDGIDSAGEAMATYRIDSPTDYAALTACIDLCEKEPACRNITLAKADHPVIGKQNMCWLTDDNVTRSPSPFYYSATRKP